MGDGTAPTRDGTRIAYTLRGEAPPDAPRLALIHSLALDHGVWAPVAERLAGRVHVLTYDCRGHGASSRTSGPYTLDRFADDLADLLDHVGWRSAAVAGASMGGSVAQAFAVRYPGRVEALGLVDTTAWYGPEAPQAWEQRAAQAEQNGLESLIDFQLPRWFSDQFRAEHPEVLARFAAVFTANDAACYGAACRMLGGYDLREQVAALDVPTAVIVGDEDYATPPAMARELHQAIAGSTLDVLPATRHLSPLERPDEIARRLEDLLARRVARTPAARA